MHKNGMRPIHPGEILKEEFLEPLGVTPAALARALHVSAPTVNDIVRERRNISADVALRLAKALGTSAQFWLNLQASYDLRKAEIEKGEEIYRDVHLLDCCAFSQRSVNDQAALEPICPSVIDGNTTTVIPTLLCAACQKKLGASLGKAGKYRYRFIPSQNSGTGWGEIGQLE